MGTENKELIVLKDIGDSSVRFTNDIKLAASLITCGIPVVQVRKQENPRNHRVEVLFGFEATQDLRDSEMKYLSNNLFIDASTILDNRDKLLSYVSNGSRDVLDSMYR